MPRAKKTPAICANAPNILNPAHYAVTRAGKGVGTVLGFIEDRQVCRKPLMEPRNLMIVGSSASQDPVKNYIIPEICRSALYGDSMIVALPRGSDDIYIQTKARLAERGYKSVYIQSSPSKLVWLPLNDYKTPGDPSMALSCIVGSAVETALLDHGRPRADFACAAEQLILAAMDIILVSAGHLTPDTLVYVLRGDVKSFLSRLRHALAHSGLSGKSLKAFRAHAHPFLDAPAVLQDVIFYITQRAVALLTPYSVGDSLRFKFDEFLQHPTAVFIELAQSTSVKRSSDSALINALLAYLYTGISNQREHYITIPERRVVFYFPDLLSYGAIPSLDSLLARSHQWHVGTTMCVPDIPSLRDKYTGAGCRTILNACQLKLFLRITGKGKSSTAAYVAEEYNRTWRPPPANPTAPHPELDERDSVCVPAYKVLVLENDLPPLILNALSADLITPDS